MSQITLPDNVKPLLSPRCRPTTQYAFVPAMRRNFFKLKPGDLLKWDIEGDEIIIKVIKPTFRTYPLTQIHFLITCA